MLCHQFECENQITRQGNIALSVVADQKEAPRPKRNIAPAVFIGPKRSFALTEVQSMLGGYREVFQFDTLEVFRAVQPAIGANLVFLQVDMQTVKADIRRASEGFMDDFEACGDLRDVCGDLEVLFVTADGKMI